MECKRGLKAAESLNSQDVAPVGIAAAILGPHEGDNANHVNRERLK